MEARTVWPQDTCSPLPHHDQLPAGSTVPFFCGWAYGFQKEDNISKLFLQLGVATGLSSGQRDVRGRGICDLQDVSLQAVVIYSY